MEIRQPLSPHYYVARRAAVYSSCGRSVQAKAAQAKAAGRSINHGAATASPMSCWVAPTRAAEIWQISVELLMSRIDSGEIPVRREDGFLFVDVAPYVPPLERPLRPAHERPAAFTPADADDANDADDTPLMVTDAEAAALTMPEPLEAAPLTQTADADDEMGPEDDTASVTLDDWRAARRKTARTRTPPPRPR